MVRGYIRKADLGKDGSCHLFRHTAAPLMLEGGTDIRYVQEMLGHKKLDTAQIYTRVSITKLAEVHAATHPGARILQPSQRPSKRQEAAENKTAPDPAAGGLSPTPER